MRAAAPSEIWEELPAVITPSSLNAGRSAAMRSPDVPVLMPWSRVTVPSPVSMAEIRSLLAGTRTAPPPARPTNQIQRMVMARAVAKVAARDSVSAPIGAPVVKRACWTDPVTCSSAARLGGGDCGFGFPRRCRFGPPRRAGVKLERPQRRAGRRGRGRTSLRPASGGRGSEARNSLLRVWRVGGAAGWSPRRAWLSEWSHMHPSGARLVTGRS